MESELHRVQARLESDAGGESCLGFDSFSFRYVDLNLTNVTNVMSIESTTQWFEKYLSNHQITLSNMDTTRPFVIINGERVNFIIQDGHIEAKYGGQTQRFAMGKRRRSQDMGISKDLTNWIRHRSQELAKQREIENFKNSFTRILQSHTELAKFIKLEILDTTGIDKGSLRAHLTMIIDFNMAGFDNLLSCIDESTVIKLHTIKAVLES